MIKFVIFDIGGIFLKGDIDDFIRRASKLLKTKIKKDTLFMKALNEWMRGTITSKKFIENISGVPVSDHDKEKIEDLWSKNWKIDKKMISFAKSLKPKYKLAMLSNTERETVERQGEEFDFFDFKFRSFELGLIKPEKEIYLHVLKTLKAAPEECVFIDDNEKNIEMSKKLNIPSILFENKRQLKKELKILGVIT